MSTEQPAAAPTAADTNAAPSAGSDATTTAASPPPPAATSATNDSLAKNPSAALAGVGDTVTSPPNPTSPNINTAGSFSRGKASSPTHSSGPNKTASFVFGRGGLGGTSRIESSSSEDDDDEDKEPPAPPTALERAGVDPNKLHRTVKDSYEPTSGWFDDHYYYPSHLTPFFSSEGTLKRNAEAALALENDSTMKELVAKMSNREHNLSAVHHSLFPKTKLMNNVIMLPVVDFMEFMRTLVTPCADLSHCERWVKHVGLVDEGCVPYEDVLHALDKLFNGELKTITSDRCFKLCDTTKSEHILKHVFQQLRGNDEKSPDDGDITYLVVKGIMRAFDKVAQIEEEEVRAAFLKKNKKLRKKKNLVIPMPTKRQFHINPDEFSNFLSTDPHLVLAFLPYVIKSHVTKPVEED